MHEHELLKQIGRLEVEFEWLKKLPTSAQVKRRCIEPEHESLSNTRQCQRLGLARSNWHHVPQGELLSRQLSNTLTGDFCIEAQEAAPTIATQGNRIFLTGEKYRSE